MSENVTNRERYGLPRTAYRLGTDARGYVHYHSAFEGRIWVFSPENDPHIRMDLGDRSVWEWVEHVRSEHGGWTELRLRRGRGFADLAADVADGFEKE